MKPTKFPIRLARRHNVMVANRIHVRLAWRGLEVTFRDLAAGDLPRIADYWLNADSAFLERLGVDASRFGGAEGIIARFESAIPTGDPGQSRLAFAFDVDGEMVGYTNLNRYNATENYSHWHVIDPQWRKSGLSTLLYPYRLETYFSCVPIER